MSTESLSAEPINPTRAVPLLPLATGVVFPEMVVTLRLETEDARRAVTSATELDSEIVVVPRAGTSFSTIGTLARIEQHGTLRDGSLGAVIRGVHRAQVGQGVLDESGRLGFEVTPLPEPDVFADGEAEELMGQYRDTVGRLLDALGGQAWGGLLNEPRTPGALADTIGWWPNLPVERKRELLETLDPLSRLRTAVTWANEMLVEHEATSSVDRRVGESLDKAQREVILRRQLDAIRAELGEGGENVVDGYRSRLAELRDGAEPIPAAVDSAIAKEIDRLERTGENGPEASWIRTWLDTVLDLPWGVRTEDSFDLTAARAVLDADHTGLSEAKDRIVEFLAVRQRRAERAAGALSGPSAGRRGVAGAPGRRGGTILVLAGPPGVGKTSLGESVARALGRRFVRASLGGVHDESEIRGHRRTYVGARPGRIARALIDAGALNPVILLDEIDKLGSDWRGDPSAALLEVLDPAQNHTFRDHYLEFELDLSDVVFIATANTLDRMPAPLLDRMEIITISGYSDDEKLAIARDHLLPRVFDRNAVEEGEIVVPDEVVRAVISDFTRESGVRKLEQRLDRLVRKAATRLATGEVEGPSTIELGELRPVLGRPATIDDPADRLSGPGIATGLAVTGAGGDVLFVEAALVPGEPGLTLTGQLGDVMRESGEIAVSFLRSHAEELGFEPTSFDRRVHVHFPAGAVPKDGPSAGITMATALASLVTGRPVRPEVAMTGEITLQGRVLPIGGVKEKVLAAHRAGVTEVILPVANRDDADDLPDDVRSQVTLHFARDIGEVLGWALRPAEA